MGFECGFTKNELGDSENIEDKDLIYFWCSTGRYFDSEICRICDNTSDSFKVSQSQIFLIMKACEEYIENNDLVYVTPVMDSGSLEVEDDDGYSCNYDLNKGFWINKAENFDYDKLMTYKSLREALLLIMDYGKDVWYYRSY